MAKAKEGELFPRLKKRDGKHFFSKFPDDSRKMSHDIRPKRKTFDDQKLARTFRTDAKCRMRLRSERFVEILSTNDSVAFRSGVRRHPW
jgi:hypothetical protein